MAVPVNITTGEQSVTATGAITGSLDTSALTGDFTIKVRVRGLTGAQAIRIAVEDTANVTAFSDALQVAVKDFKGAQTADGDEWEWRSYDLPDIRFGATNTKLRLNCQAITASTTALVIGWIEQ